MGDQKVPKGYAQGTKGVGTRYQMGEQKIPKGNQMRRKANQKVPKWQPEGNKVLSEGIKQ
jgi:hypothetical protein